MSPRSGCSSSVASIARVTSRMAASSRVRWSTRCSSNSTARTCSVTSRTTLRRAGAPPSVTVWTSTSTSRVEPSRRTPTSDTRSSSASSSRPCTRSRRSVTIGMNDRDRVHPYQLLVGVDRPCDRRLGWRRGCVPNGDRRSGCRRWWPRRLRGIRFPWGVAGSHPHLRMSSPRVMADLDLDPEQTRRPFGCCWPTITGWCVRG